MSECFRNLIHRCWRCGISNVALFRDPLLDYVDTPQFGLCAACTFARGVIKNRHTETIARLRHDAS